MASSQAQLLSVLQQGTSFLEKKGVEHPRLNFEHLLASVLGIKRLELYLQFERILEESELEPLRILLKKRADGVPLQHLLGTAEFFGRTFYSDPRALIPRPETEQLVEHALTYDADSYLDLGTGSGVIALTLALEKPEATITAVDISLEALDLAKKNAELLGINKIAWHHGDLFSSFSDSFSCEVIVANLPYLTPEEMLTLSKEVSADPLLALDGGEEGLSVIKKLILQAPLYLKKRGKILLEIGQHQAQHVVTLLKERGFSKILILHDYQGVERFVEAQLYS